VGRREEVGLLACRQVLAAGSAAMDLPPSTLKINFCMVVSVWLSDVCKNMSEHYAMLSLSIIVCIFKFGG